ncbi:MAG TPA: galactose-1-phosphate uridylyltransferase [Candidatus Limnocylindrales bacterium]|nr:galactose-1-phosphate uridylyltransferase [Candidatus Limnocylindrales bacterium]
MPIDAASGSPRQPGLISNSRPTSPTDRDGRSGHRSEPGVLARLERHTLTGRAARRLYVYGELRGTIGPDWPTVQPGALQERLDRLTGTWIAFSPARNTRPHSSDRRLDATACPLCPGGPEVPFSYDAAVFDNRYPALLEPAPPVAASPTVRPSSGRCEVVLYTEQHEGSLATLSPEALARVVAVWRDRSNELWADERHRFVLVFENRGEAVGATLSHPHGQIYAFDHLPPLIRARVEALDAGRRETHGCVPCAVTEADASSDRLLEVDGPWVVAVPFASRWPYEVHVRARRHDLRRFGDMTAGDAAALARALRRVVLRYDRLFGFELPYMMTVLEAPDGADDWHLGIEFLPPHRNERLTKVRASVETATGLFITDQLPETSAARLRRIDIPDVAEAPALEAVEVDPA